MKIKNLRLKGQRLLVGNEFIEFNEDGIAFIDDGLGEGLLALPNYFKADDELTAKDEVKELEVEEVAVDIEAAVDYNELTTGELKKLLEEKGIEYPKNAKKDKLIELLK